MIDGILRPITLFPRKLDTINGIAFYFLGKMVEDVLHSWIYMVGSPKEAKNFACRISVSSIDGKEEHFHKGPVFPLDDNCETVMGNDSIFSMKNTLARRMFDDEFNLTFKNL